jgi:hypothetical protein
MPYFLDKYMGGMSNQECFEHFGMDAILWIVPHRPDTSKEEYYDPLQGEIGFLESRRVSTDQWRVEYEKLPDSKYKSARYRFVTPKGVLTTVLQSNEHTSWVAEYLIKRKQDIDLIGEYVTAPKCDVEEVNQGAEAYGGRGIVRGHICCFDVFGQPGTWQDAACLVGTQKLILATFVISPQIFETFVAPYDSELITLAHEAGQRIVYHTCGGMMPILENIAAMSPDAMETFTPPDMSGDVDLAEAKARLGDKVCMIGGFDQFHYLIGCTEQETRAAVRRCFEAVGEQGGYILSPSDHFFDADPKLIRAYADEARQCVY